MIVVPPQARCFLLPTSISFEAELDAIVAYCRQFGMDPFSGDIYALSDPAFNMIGLLSYDGQGFQWSIKRFSAGNLDWWPVVTEPTRVEAKALTVMLLGGNPKDCPTSALWRPIT